MAIRWLHLSDVHECAKDGYHREAMYEALVAEASESHPPDFVFFTGDLAFSGKAAEYELLKERLLKPLRAVLPAHCMLFAVPGNHDVERNRVGKPRLWMEDNDERDEFQRVDASGKRKRGDALLPRFEAYRALENEATDWNDDWLSSEQGSICKIAEIGGRRIAVVGVNTAWLCQDDDDWGRLTAGRTMVDAALRKASTGKPDLVIVLGHHPLAAMTGEKEWSDGDRIRQLLEQANAIYLHGHLHLAGGQRAGDALQSVLAIQAPSGFQAADSKVWRNGVLWGAADLDAGALILTPKRWNDDFKRYVFDSDAVHPRFRVQGEDSFAFPLPGRAIGRNGERPEAIPQGWEIIDAETLAAKTAKRPTAKEMGDWFNGRFASWEVAVATGVRPRRAVDEMVRRFEAAHAGAPLPIVVLLTGAGGEGKSTALLQTVAQLVQGPQKWTCLWRNASAAPVSEDLLARLEPRAGHAWIVAVDDAENVGIPLAKALRRIQPRTDVHLILAAREADWSIRGLTDWLWRNAAMFSRTALAGLDAEDARRIADGWVAYGDEAMGKLRNQTAEQAAQTLLAYARTEAARQTEGALLGALLIAREGQDLKNRVVGLMSPWADTPGIGEHSLLDIYAMIAVMHAENLSFLSYAVLAYALGCDEGALERGPLKVLRREAMIDGGTTYVLTRHRKIGEAACDWLSETGYNPAKWYPFLARAGRRHFLEKRPAVHDAAKWTYELAQHFAQKADHAYWPDAVAIAAAIYSSEKGNPLLLTAYANILRDIEQPGAALALFRREAQQVKADRGVFYEWSVAAGHSGDHGLAAWLAGKSITDDRTQKLDAMRCKLSLAGLGAAFEALRKKTNRADFGAAEAACGRLGLRLPSVDAETRKSFERYKGNAGAQSLDQDVETLRRTTLKASYETEQANDPTFFENLIGDPDSYRFSMLRNAIEQWARDA